MALLHEKQTFVLPAVKPEPRVNPTKDSRPVPEKQPIRSTASVLALKCFVFLMPIGLTISTLLGIALAILYGGEPRVVWAIVLAGEPPSIRA